MYRHFLSSKYWLHRIVFSFWGPSGIFQTARIDLLMSIYVEGSDRNGYATWCFRRSFVLGLWMPLSRAPISDGGVYHFSWWVAIVFIWSMSMVGTPGWNFSSEWSNCERALYMSSVGQKYTALPVDPSDCNETTIWAVVDPTCYLKTNKVSIYQFYSEHSVTISLCPSYPIPQTYCISLTTFMKDLFL